MSIQDWRLVKNTRDLHVSANPESNLPGLAPVVEIPRGLFYPLMTYGNEDDAFLTPHLCLCLCKS